MKLKIQIFSDLHQEYFKNYLKIPPKTRLISNQLGYVDEILDNNIKNYGIFEIEI